MPAATEATPLEAVFRRDRAAVIVGLTGISLLAWVYMVYLSVHMEMTMGMEMALPQMDPWGPVDFVLTLVMWAVMMVAMMVPSAAPMILLFATIQRKRRERESPAAPTAIFLAGYLAAWTWYSALATLGQWGLHSAALLSARMMNTSPIVGGGLLIAAGLFQFTPLKYACLTRCRSPLQFLLNEWREGPRGAFVMGLRNGNYCVVCCWALMALMFVTGAMSLLWMAIIAAFVLLEKVGPEGPWVNRISGSFLVLVGLWMVGTNQVLPCHG